MKIDDKIETKRLILREFSHADFEDVHGYSIKNEERRANYKE